MRVVRGGVVGVTTSSLAWLSHSLAAGMSLQLSHLLWVLAFAVPVSIALSGRRWTLPSLLTVLLGGQVAFHLTFAGMYHASGGSALPTGMHVHVPVGAIAAMGDGSIGVRMLLAHSVAALVTALVLRRGEDWCWALTALMTRPWASGPVRGLPLASMRLRLGVPMVAHAQHELLLSGSQPRRGPPVLAL